MDLSECENLHEWVINVTLHETKDLRYISETGATESLPNQWLSIKLGTQVFNTAVRSASSSSAYDQRMTFNIKATLQDLGYHLLEFSAYHQLATGLSSVLMGKCCVCPRTIYNRSGQSCIRVWEELCHPDEPASDRGSICLSVQLVDDAKRLDASAAVVTSSVMAERHYFSLLVNIYKGQDIATTTLLGQSVSEPYVELIHGTSKAQTRTVSLNANPDWNTQLALTTKEPTLDDYLRISLWNGRIAPVLCGVRLFNIRELIRMNNASLFWINYYWNAPGETQELNNLSSMARSAVNQMSAGIGALKTTELSTDWDTTPPQLVCPSTYAGRVLVSISIRNVHEPTRIISTVCAMSQPPKSTMYVLHGQIFELASALHDVGPIQVEVAVGPHSSMTKDVCYKNDRYRFRSDEGDGQLTPIRIPVDNMEDAWFVYVYVHSSRSANIIDTITGGMLTSLVGNVTSSTVQRVAHTYLTLKQIASFGEKPTWVTLHAMDSRLDVFKVLLRFVLRSEQGLGNGDEELPEMHLDKAYESKQYIIRAFIYEATNIKCPSTCTLPSPYVKVELGSWSWTTKSTVHCSNPQIYQSVEQEVTLPDDIALADDITVSIYHKAEGVLSADELLGQTHYRVKDVPKVWDDVPAWLDITDSAGWAGSILCAFEILKLDEADNYPFYEDIRPSTYPASVLLVLLGVNTLQPLQKPRVRLSFGRDLRDSNVRLWEAYSGAPQNETQLVSSSSWTFNQNFHVSLEVPKRYYHYSYLEIELYSENQFTEPVSASVLPLAEAIPWLKGYEKEFLADIFAQVTQDSGDAFQAIYNAHRERKNKKSVRGTRDDGTNEVDYNASVRQSVSFIAPDEMSKVTTNTSTVSVDIYVPKEPNGTRRSGSQTQLLENRNLKKLQFKLEVEEDLTLTEDETREMIGGPLESILDFKDLPYRVTDLVVPSAGNYPVTVGHVKYLLTTQELDVPGSQLKFQQLWTVAAGLKASNIELRVYCLSARSLKVSDSVGSTMNFYLILDFPGSKELDKVVVDKANARARSVDPVFNKCYRFTVEFPQFAILRIRVMQIGTLQDEEVGETMIDLENLWWLDQYRDMVMNHSLPIETRTLRKYEPKSNLLTDFTTNLLQGNTALPSSHAGQVIPRNTGLLNMWVELMPVALAQSRPIAVLSSPDPQPFQLRVVIWQLRGCQMGDQSSLSLICAGSIRHADDTLEVQWTDTHFNSRDGTAIFNWRLVWDIYIPARFSSLTLAVHQHSLIGTGELLGHCIIDLQKDFAIAQRSKTEHEIPATWINLTNPREPNVKQAELQYEISIVSQRDATAQPVGKGRDEPNRSPYLEPVLENRSYVDWQGWGKSLTGLGASIMWTSKWLVYIIIVGLLLFSIIWLVVVLK